MMSLSRVYKKTSKIIFQDVVSIHANQVLEASYDGHAMNQDEIEHHNQILSLEDEKPLWSSTNAEIKVNTDEETQLDITLKIEAAIKIAREEAFHQAYMEHKAELKNQLMERLDRFDQLVNLLLDESKTLNEQFNKTLQTETMKMSLALTQKILHQQILQDSSILKDLILNEIQQESKLNVHSIELSKHALHLIDSLEFELKNQGISILSVDQPIDHINIVGEYGHYDISINTQFKEIRKTLHQWLK